MSVLNLDLMVAISPLAVLIYLMTKKRPVPAFVALPVVAAGLWILKLTYFKDPAIEVNATVIDGLLTALKPITIVWGAIFLFKSMEHSGAMGTLREWLNGITTNRVAQVMIVAWSFSFLIEGSAGFGTPVAIAAPILVGLGFEAVPAVIVCLVFNSVPVTFGAVGVPMWFGLGEVGLGGKELVEVGFVCAMINATAALTIGVIGMLFVATAREVKANIGFIVLSIGLCVGPYLGAAYFNVEFPSIIGGLFGTVLSVVLAHYGVGLAGEKAHKPGIEKKISRGKLVKAMFPLWATVGILLVTRIDAMGLKGLLNAERPVWGAVIPWVGTFTISPALSVTIKNILGTATTWNHKFLYIPFIIPFFVVGFATLALLRAPRQEFKAAWSQSIHRMRHPVIALLGTLVFAKLFMAGPSSCTMFIGKALAQAAGNYWYYFAWGLGALGSFFAGSNTISNLTFAPIQISIAGALGLNKTLVLALQCAGGAMGKMICIHDIVAACSVIGLSGVEGLILKRTIIPMLVYAAIAAALVPLLLLYVR